LALEQRNRIQLMDTSATGDLSENKERQFTDFNWILEFSKTTYFHIATDKQLLVFHFDVDGSIRDFQQIRQFSVINQNLAFWEWTVDFLALSFIYDFVFQISVPTVDTELVSAIQTSHLL
jgi:hypothetical protein